MSFHRFLGRLVLAISALFLALPSAAQDLYSVRGVEVEATASDASQARQAGIAMGQSRALQRLWARLIPDEMMNRAPSLSSQQIENLIEDFGVSNERSGDQTYRAELNVRFRPGEVRRLLREANIPYAEQQGPPVLLLPVYEDSSGPRLWSGSNPWHDAWKRRDETGLVPILVPMGDLSDVAAIDAERAVAQDRSALEQFASAYDADSVLLTIARLSGDPQDDTAGLSIELRRYGGDFEGAMNMVSVRQQADEPLQRFYDRAVQQVDNRIQETWKSANVLRFDQQQEILVRVPLRSLQDWVQIQRQLTNTARVTGHEIRHLSREEGIVALAFVGDEASLRSALGQSNLALERLEEAPAGWPEWELTSRFMPTTPPGPEGDAAAGSAAPLLSDPDQRLDQQESPAPLSRLP